jgi:Nuclear cap-binding protein subunit 3
MFNLPSAPAEIVFYFYFSLGVDMTSEEEISTNERGIRLNAVHIRGVNDMSTQQVFDYFAEFAPTVIEWVDDSSCM